MNKVQRIFAICLFASSSVNGAEVLNLTTENGAAQLTLNDHVLMTTPTNAHWSVGIGASGLRDLSYQHAPILEISKLDNGFIFKGELTTELGTWKLQDTCLKKRARFECTRRFHWTGETTLRDVVLSIRWLLNTPKADIFMPSLIHYGNPSGKRMDKTRVAYLDHSEDEFAQFEEHRFSMPFVVANWSQNQSRFAGALHTNPSPLLGAKRDDLWWSLGSFKQAEQTELRLLSGPTGFNHQADIIKLFQRKNAKYNNARIDIKPNTIIEKTYHIQAYKVNNIGSGFIGAMKSSIDIFKPTQHSQFPNKDSVLERKFDYMLGRYLEGEDYAGFNMFEHSFRKQIVMGWAGQSDAPAYTLLYRGLKENNQQWLDMAIKSLNFLVRSTFSYEKGFAVRYNIDTKTWSHYDFVSQGQALFMLVNASRLAKASRKIDTNTWDAFINHALKFHAKRILADDWQSLSTNEAFLVAPLAQASSLYNNETYKKAAIKAAQHFGERHLDMSEPYWGGTLDAKGEDKEGAWAALQAFMSAYELTGDKQFIRYAIHAAEVTLTYTVIWDIAMPPGRLSDARFNAIGWTTVSVQNQHLDVYGILATPTLYRLGQITNNQRYIDFAKLMFLSVGQLVDHQGRQGEQILHTNFVQDRQTIKEAGDNPEPSMFRGGYSEDWTVLWITTHFLTAATMFDEMNIKL